MNHFILQAFRGITANKSRTALTTLGIVIGIATVILVLSAGAGFKSYINAQIEQFGSNTVTIETQVPPSTRDRQNAKGGDNAASQAIEITSLKKRDIVDITVLPNVKNAYGAVIGQQVVGYDNILKNSFIFGADASRFEIDKGEIATGRPYTKEEDRALAQVAILGADIAKNLFGNADPLGKTIRVGSYNFIVIGVYAPRGSFGFSNDDEQVFIPASTLQKKILGIDHYFYAVVELYDNTLSKVTSLDIADTLRRNHTITDPAKDDFKVQTQDQNMATFDTILSATTFLLIAIATISLIVGGVGVMNIMYVVVTERTAEIGLKKALGATSKDILYEFLLEAIAVTVLGGIVGIIVGVGFSFLVAKVVQAFGMTWKFIVPLSGVVIGFSVSVAIGIIFGVFPARNAARLDPIEALRYE